jgi:hypothetical protein
LERRSACGANVFRGHAASGIECLELESCRRQSQVTGLYGSSGAEKRKLGPTKWLCLKRSLSPFKAQPFKLVCAPLLLSLPDPDSEVQASRQLVNRPEVQEVPVSAQCKTGPYCVANACPYSQPKKCKGTPAAKDRCQWALVRVISSRLNPEAKILCLCLAFEA